MHILKYIKGNVDVGPWYPKNDSLDLHGYTDSDLAGCRIDRKSTSGTCQFLGIKLISWMSKKQISIALSTDEAEYVAAAEATKEIVWLRKILEYL